MEPTLHRLQPDAQMPERQGRCLAGRRNGWVILDKAWAARLGVQRTNGVYRIRQGELVQRLAAVQESLDHAAADPRQQKPRSVLRVLRVVRYAGDPDPSASQAMGDDEQH
jgi:hypothetical protein